MRMFARMGGERMPRGDSSVKRPLNFALSGRKISVHDDLSLYVFILLPAGLFPNVGVIVFIFKFASVKKENNE